jgi:hypothetical protein
MKRYPGLFKKKRHGGGYHRRTYSQTVFPMRSARSVSLNAS